MIGENIKKLRTQNQMTQKDLADKLFVTSQAVSRWENGEVEPSLSTLQEIAKIFNVTMNELFANEEDNKINDDSIEKEQIEDGMVHTRSSSQVRVIKEDEKIQNDEKVVYVVKESKPVLCICSQCHKPIYEQKDIVTKTTYGMRRERHETYICSDCDKANKIRRERELREERQKRRIHSFIWPSLIFIIVLIVAITNISKGDSRGWIIFAGSFLSFTFSACMILSNNIIPEVWIAIASKSIAWPGLIFTLDLDGIVWFITVKLTLMILSFLFSIFLVLLATGIGFALSLFVYPFALRNNIKNIETENELYA